MSAVVPLNNRNSQLQPVTRSEPQNAFAARGCLRAAVLSAYDLPLRDPPSHVSISVGNTVVCTGPPVQRHKDRNAFKFAAGSGVSEHSGNHVSITLPLAELYEQTAVIQLVYSNQPSQTLTTTYELKQLKIHEKTWLILPLSGAPETSGESHVKDDDDDDTAPPTIRLQLVLEGPYRTEIAALLQVSNAWFGLVDAIEDNIKELLAKCPKVSLPDSKYFLIPAAPILSLLVVSLPILLGVLLVGLPMFLPLLVVVGTVLLCVAVIASGLYCSTSSGRSQVQALFHPVVQAIIFTSWGQRLIYVTGPRPTPVNVAVAILPEHIWGKLIVSLIIDACGSASYLLPLVGEGFDIAWAPIQTILIMAMYDATSPNLKYLSFFEEILPLTDIIPSATLGWLIEYAYPSIAQGMGLQ
ncbi:hypothetical protein FisN_20Hh278 [Fistulifera solaris]|uniref:Uncharacterized protein n=1 Tax=Fistulifera solaris TaxID=1519565 RepID=A0A1Z5JQL0_FISSO|nr:hypothetical protein FisN_20Hh278 [Fistulifera solaris]|eukprot:GAX16048.1 hypothetical protein FisN_20Hh278 [Fistulifera solaris]